MGQRLPATLSQFFRVWRPRTPGLRHKRLLRNDHLYDGPPVGSLLAPLNKTGGRCRITGRITSFHRGGGEKHTYRLIDWNRSVPGPHLVLRLEKDPNRSAHIALLQSKETNLLSYILAPKDTQSGDVLYAGDNVPPVRGNCLPLKAIPPGTLIHNIGLRPGEGGKLARSAGTYAQLLRTGQSGYAQVKMCSGEIRFLPVAAKATIGTVSNPFHKLEIVGTAGANRRKGRRPHVRGVAMNPCDHPMGGRGNRGMPSTSPWGKITKGKFTVKKERQKFVIQPRPTRNVRTKQPSRKSGRFLVQDQMDFAFQINKE